MPKADSIIRGAVISPCGNYRYNLTRRWGPGNIVTWVMMNPSTADALVDDATIRKCMGFAERWNFDGINVVNLFAWRSRNPLDLVGVVDPYGPDYAKYFDEAIDTAAVVVAAWGCESTLNKVRALRARAQLVTQLLAPTPHQRRVCLGMSKKGTPYHPLMLAYSTMARDYTPYEP